MLLVAGPRRYVVGCCSGGSRHVLNGILNRAAHFRGGIAAKWGSIAVKRRTGCRKEKKREKNVFSTNQT